MRWSVVSLVVAAAATGGLVLVGVTSGRDDPAPPAAPAAPAVHTPSPFQTTPLTAFDSSAALVRRGAFCDDVDPRQVTAALGGPSAAERGWREGDRTPLGPGIKDVASEFGCEYAAADGSLARAWVFAPPVSPGTARRLARAAVKARGCTEISAAPAFGAPSTALTCATAKGVRTASYRGLFGDAWLTCELAVPVGSTLGDDALADRAGRWCVGVATAASG